MYMYMYYTMTTLGTYYLSIVTWDGVIVTDPILVNLLYTPKMTTINKATLNNVIICTCATTVEPPIKDLLRKGQPLYEGHSISPTPTVYSYIKLLHFQLPKRGQSPYKGQNDWAQPVLY